MDEYPSVCYLDVQKTGSTFVSAFLAAHLAERRIRFQKHGRIKDGYDPHKLYVISCRHPLDQYVSLFRFGLAGEGMLRRTLEARGHGALYAAGFGAWLGFMLDPENAGVLRESYEKAPYRLIGFQTFRFLALAFERPIETLSRLTSREKVREAWETRRIVQKVLRTETLNADLADLVSAELRPHVRDPEAALRALAESAPRNAARPGTDGAAELLPRLKERLRDREWFLFDVLGYRLD